MEDEEEFELVRTKQFILEADGCGRSYSTNEYDWAYVLRFREYGRLREVNVVYKRHDGKYGLIEQLYEIRIES